MVAAVDVTAVVVVGVAESGMQLRNARNSQEFTFQKTVHLGKVFDPDWTRMFLLEHYRGIKYEQCFADKETLRRYQQWYDACSSLDAVTATQKSQRISNQEYRQELIKKYERYATNTAKSMVAEAVNKNTAMP